MPPTPRRSLRSFAEMIHTESATGRGKPQRTLSIPSENGGVKRYPMEPTVLHGGGAYLGSARACACERSAMSEWLMLKPSIRNRPRERPY